MTFGDAPLQAEFPLVDAHCHGVVGSPLSRSAFEQLLTESDRPAPAGSPYGSGPLARAVLRWCAPALDLASHASLDAYLARRTFLGFEEIARRCLSLAGLSHLLVDTGFGGPIAPLRELAGGSLREVVRLEALAEQLANEGVRHKAFADVFATRLASATSNAVGVKSIVAYRHGFDLPPARPTPLAVEHSVAHWLRTSPDRLVEPIVLRFLLWSGIDLGLPVQIHCGFGDPDIRLAHVNPALLQPFIEAVEPYGTPLVLLHCYPYHREAAWLAAMYPHVYVDVGLTLSHVGVRAPDVLAEFLELAPPGKVLFSSDAYGLPELYLTGAAQFRWAFSEAVTRWGFPLSDARLIGSENALRLYSLL